MIASRNPARDLSAQAREGADYPSLNLTLDIGKHSPVDPKAGDVVADNLPDQSGTVEIVKKWGVILLDSTDFWIANEWYFTFSGEAAKKHVHLISKRGRGPRRTISLGKFLMSPAPGLIVDHIDGNVLDNRRRNLRVCTMQENNWNRKRRKGGASRFKGVSRDHNVRSRWMSMIARPGGGNIYLGSFANEEDAARAYDVEARARYGAFAALNFPNVGERCAALPVEPSFHSKGNTRVCQK